MRSPGFKKRMRVVLLGGSILLLTASRPTKPNTTEVTVEGSVGQLEERELAGSKTFPGGGCGGSETVKVHRHYEEKQAGGTLGVVHTTASEKTLSAEASAYETTRVRSTLLPGDRDFITKEAEYGTRLDAGTVIRLGSTKKKAHWELGTAVYQVKDKTLIYPSGMIRLGSAGPAYAYADVFGSSIIPLGSYTSTGLGFDFGNKSIEAKVGFGPRSSYGSGLEGQLPLGRRFRFKLGGMSFNQGTVYEQWHAYSGLTLVAGSGVAPKANQAEAAQKPDVSASPPVAPEKKQRWIDKPTSSPFLDY